MIELASLGALQTMQFISYSFVVGLGFGYAWRAFFIFF